MPVMEQETAKQCPPEQQPSCHDVIIRLHHGEAIRLCSSGQETKTNISGMRELMCLKEEPPPQWNGLPDAELIGLEEMPTIRNVMHRNPMTEIAYSEDWERLFVAGWIRSPRNVFHYRHYLWQTALICGATHALLKGRNAILVHCSVLETERGAVLLFGESGMGKSTASARWRAQGGKCISDDMALLDFSGGDEIYVRRMPTWSACKEGKNEWNYPAGEELPLIDVLALGRSESGRDEIVELSPAQYFAQCYRSMFYWYTRNTKSLPDDMKDRLANYIRRFTDKITGENSPRALLTVPEGNDLRTVIEEYLQTK